MWQEKAAEKVSRLTNSIPSAWRLPTPVADDNVMSYPSTSGLLTADELALTDSTAVDLLARLANGQLTSAAVTAAFCKRAALAHQLVNCALEFFPEQALQRAAELDAYFASHGPSGPLHGLPVSLKDQFRIKGLETSMGYVDWLGRFETEDSILVTLLYNAGAVLYVKTSVPQSLMHTETLNNIIGRTVNPRNKHLSCGGSSGGEGALLALRGSILGVGTDIGGSVRIPSAHNFLYGLKPSHGRFPYAKAANSMAGQQGVNSVCGPLCHSIADMKVFVKAILAQEPWRYDSKVIPLPWRQSEEDAAVKKLTIAYYNFDGIVMPHAPVIRGVNMAVEAANAAGHVVIPWEPYKHGVGAALGVELYKADGGKDILDDINRSGEPVLPHLHHLQSSSALTLNEAWDLNLQTWTYQCEYLAALKELEDRVGEIDAIIAPVAPTAAVRHDKERYVGYTSVINLLDLTSVVVPVTYADKDVDIKGTYEPVNGLDGRIYAEYDAAAYHGAPVGVQVVGRRLSEEKTMAIASELGRLLGNEFV